MEKLDDLLKDQQKLPPDNFTASTLARLPQQRLKQRPLILGTSLGLAALISFIVLSTQDTFSQLFQLKSPLTIIALALILGSVLIALFNIAHEEMAL